MEPPAVSFHYVENIDAGNVDVDVDPLVNPKFLPPSFSVEAKQPIYGDVDKMKTDVFDGDNFDASDNMGYLEILSSKDDNPNDKSSWEGTNIIVPSVRMKFKNEKEVFEFYKNYTY
ncbi:uncharacterized protein LOC111379607 [Olea europaea var. sylvestris]|uniref:uncharacterized protein LOC111379607 n=1 Tax=Olea europaea var. sylvestris TaxID=158386 RepID=UPI000C1D2177|nr:uncharacterized protein LOC111379607 [Olea europaea var. sylvestris]